MEKMLGCGGRKEETKGLKDAQWFWIAATFALLLSGVEAQERDRAFAKVFRGGIGMPEVAQGVDGLLQVEWQGKPGDVEGISSRLYGTVEEAATELRLNISFKDPSSDWKLTQNPEPPEHGFEVATGAPVGGRKTWVWRGRLQVESLPQAPENAQPPMIQCTLSWKIGDTQAGTNFVVLWPADIWVIAGGRGVQPSGKLDAAEANEGPQFIYDGTKAQPAVQSSYAFARGFAQSWYKAFRRPVGVIVHGQTRALLGEYRAESDPAKANEFWMTPGETKQAPDCARFPCRGLVWWHGEWEAEEAEDAAVGSLASLLTRPEESGATGRTGLRARYARDLATTVLQPWWTSMTKTPNPAWTEAEQNDLGYVKALSLVIVQLPLPRMVSPLEEGFIPLWQSAAQAAIKEAAARPASPEQRAALEVGERRAQNARPMSSWAAVRYAQFDVALQLQEIHSRTSTSVALPFAFLEGVKTSPRPMLWTPLAYGEEKEESPESSAGFRWPATAAELRRMGERLGEAAARPGTTWPTAKKEGENIVVSGLKKSGTVPPSLEWVTQGGVATPFESSQLQWADETLKAPAPATAVYLRTPAMDDPGRAFSSSGGGAAPVFEVKIK